MYSVKVFELVAHDLVLDGIEGEDAERAGHVRPPLAFLCLEPARDPIQRLGNRNGT